MTDETKITLIHLLTRLLVIRSQASGRQDWGTKAEPQDAEQTNQQPSFGSQALRSWDAPADGSSIEMLPLPDAYTQSKQELEMMAQRRAKQLEKAQVQHVLRRQEQAAEQHHQQLLQQQQQYLQQLHAHQRRQQQQQQQQQQQRS